MFERYTEKARRTIFFARYEASQFGSNVIDTEHLLLGLLREDKDVAGQFLQSAATIESIRKQIEQRSKIAEKISTSVDLPLSQEGKRVLTYAAEESDRMNHKHIGTPHLFLGLLREEQCFTASLLRECGVQLAAARAEVLRLHLESRGAPARSKSELPRGLVEILLAWADAGGVTVAANPRAGVHTPDFAVYVGSAVDTDGDIIGGGEIPPPSTPAEEIAHLRREIHAIMRRLENAIGNHEFENARHISDQEREARNLLRQKLEQHELDDLPAPSMPVLCIEVVRDRKFADLQKHCDDCLSAGAMQVWVLDLVTKRAYTVTNAEGIRECKDDLLRMPDSALELDLKKVFT